MSDTRPDYEIARETVERIAAETGIEIKAQFVPFSQSRNAKPRAGQSKPWRSLNWKVTLTVKGREVLETDYSQGEGHCPAHKSKSKAMGARASGGRIGLVRSDAIAHEIETGRIARVGFGGSIYSGKPIAPPPLSDVLHSLAMDSDVLDSGGFEDWAANYGYDTDSRAAESIYRLCLEHALKLRAAIGEETLGALRAAASEM